MYWNELKRERGKWSSEDGIIDNSCFRNFAVNGSGEIGW